MNKEFVLFDKNNNLQKNANIVVKFNLEGKDYLIYSVDENEQNCQIFVSRLVLNSEGKCFIDNILPEEKSKLNNIVYNIVILVPSDAMKGSSFERLSANLIDKFGVKLSLDFPSMEMQEYYINSSVAITNRILVESAIKLFTENLDNNKEDSSTLIPTWTAPVEVTSPVPAEPEELSSSQPVSVSVPTVPIQESVVVPDLNLQSNIVDSIDSVSTPANEVTASVQESVVVPNLNPQSNIVEPVDSVHTPIDEVTVSVPTVQVDAEKIQSNPQIEKLAIVSDPSLGIGVVQPNVGKNKKAGFANTKYIVVGTVCLVLAVAVVITAYILISNMK